MKVVNAGVAVELLASVLDADLLGDEPLAAPHLIDSEVTSVLRRLVLRGTLDERQGLIAVEGFGRLELRRYPADWLRGRMWALRHNLTGYDATYVALTERLAATSLLTTDARRGHAAGIDCPIELINPAPDR